METYDLIILGGGLAGMCAAVEAGEEGASVLLLEKQDELGGSTVLSSGYMAFAGTDMQENAEIKDTTGSLVDDLIEIGGGVNNPDLIKTYGQYQLETYQWLKDHGVEFRTLQAVSGHSVPRGHTIDPHQGIQALYKHSEGAPKCTRSALTLPAKRLLKNNEGIIERVFIRNRRRKVILLRQQKEFCLLPVVLLKVKSFSNSLLHILMAL